MKFCRKCRGVLTAEAERWVCEDCGWELEKAGGAAGDSSGTSAQGSRSRSTGGTGSTALEGLSTTDSGAVRKADAVEWLRDRQPPTEEELLRAVTPKPKGFQGSTFASEVSNVRITGDARFVETVAGLLEPFLEFEDDRTRLEINLQRTEDREAGELTDNYALYLSVAERG